MQARDYLSLDDATLLRQCRINTYKASGPGGQHRNKVSSAVRLHHPPTGVSAHGDDSRSQHENKALALKRLRMKIACTLRSPVVAGADLPAIVTECMFIARGGENAGRRRLQAGRRDARYWPVAAYLLDLLEHSSGRLADAAGRLGITSGNLVKVLSADRHALAAAQSIRKAHGLGPLL